MCETEFFGHNSKRYFCPKTTLFVLTLSGCSSSAGTGALVPYNPLLKWMKLYQSNTNQTAKVPECCRWRGLIPSNRTMTQSTHPNQSFGSDLNPTEQSVDWPAQDCAQKMPSLADRFGVLLRAHTHTHTYPRRLNAEIKPKGASIKYWFKDVHTSTSSL